VRVLPRGTNQRAFDLDGALLIELDVRVVRGGGSRRHGRNDSGDAKARPAHGEPPNGILPWSIRAIAV